MFIATLVAADRLDRGDVSTACAVVGGRAGEIVDDVACDIAFGNRATAGRAALERALPHLDVVVQVAAERRRRLLVADMDSTTITVECIDELADYAGLKTEVAAVTERAMRGEIDFADALRDRVALLAGLSEDTLAQCLRERVRPTGGAVNLIRSFRAAGGRAVLVSGGFTHFAEPVAADLGFDQAIANRLRVRDGRLTGAVEHPVVDAQAKRAALLAELCGRPASTSIAVGDGANDIPMIEAAGLGVAFHAKPTTEAAADARVRHGDLSVLGYAMGLPGI